MSEHRRAPRFARPFAVTYIAAVIACGVLTIEAWPLTGWQLFSHVRSDEQVGWKAVAVDGAGRAHDYPLARLGDGYRGFPFVVGELSSRPAGERATICRAWVRGARELIGVDASAVRIYELRWRLSERRGSRAAPPQRRLRYVCTTGGLHAVR